ncbi:hypothetical protein HMPREF3293_01309 [Christensenella minuta]|uniref:Uncharacterized protein n=1 Tax=Christensenella minuta TaxID=626937 RepID=A0A136Q5I8_9FIRM|nr:hypothetical protein HMPREF3293_01309 [Christensenella minuta]
MIERSIVIAEYFLGINFFIFSQYNTFFILYYIFFIVPFLPHRFNRKARLYPLCQI